MRDSLQSNYGQIATYLPLGLGKTFFVAPLSSALYADIQARFVSDLDGVPRLYTTIAAALAACVSGRGDKIFVLPGSYTIATAIAVSISDVSIIGLGTTGQVVLTGSAANIFNLTGSGIELAGFTLNLATTKKAIQMIGVSNSTIHDNVFLSAVGGTASHFIHMLTTVCSYNVIKNNRFVSNLDVSGGAITQTSHVTGLGIGNVIELNSFVAGRVTTANAGAVTDAVLFAAAADAGNIVRENDFTEFNGATFTAGIEYGTTAVAGSVLAIRNNLMLATAANAIVNGSNAGQFANNIASGTV